MAFEPVIIVNGISQLAASTVSLLLALKLRKEKGCLLQKPFYLLSIALFVIALLNTLWFFGIIDISAVDNLLVGPFFHLTLLAVWFYIGLFISGHHHTYYLIPLFIMSVNVLLIMNNLAFFCDIITGLVLIGVFFYVGFIDHHFIKKISYLGMAYGLSIPAMSAISHFTGTQYLHSFWFIPNAILLYILFIKMRQGHFCMMPYKPAKHHIPVVVEVFKFGFFVIALSVFLMLGTLGVHELGHSITAQVFGCSHQTSFGIGHAVTHVVCESSAGSILIILGGFILTLVVSLLMYFMGNDFAKRMSFLMLAFSILISVDDFTVLRIPYSVIIAGVFTAALLIGYGIMLIVKNYELEYERYEASLCTSAACGKESYLNPKK
jgi:hypothetical protein